MAALSAMRARALGLHAALLLVSAGGCKRPSTAPTGEVWPTTSWSSPALEALRDGLPGMTWSEGHMDTLLLEHCPGVVDQLGHCLGINPLTPFFTFRFEADANIGQPVGAFRLAPDEAVVFVGETPPEGIYLSLQNHVYARRYQADDAEHTIVLGTISPSVNQRTLAYDGPPDSPWGRKTAVIWSANTETAERVLAGLADVFADHGVDPGAIEVVPIPDLDEADQQAVASDPAYEGVDVVDLRMGYRETDDWFTVVVRIAGLPLDSPYIDPAVTPAAPFKVKLDDPPGYAPFEYPRLPPVRDGSGRPDALVAAVDRLSLSVLQRLRATGAQRARLRFSTHDFSGYRCVNRGLACGSIDDALYRSSMSTSLEPHVVTGGLFAVGVVHPDVPGVYPDAPDLAYSSVTLRNEVQRMGLVGIGHEALRGTARARFPDGIDGVSDADLDLMYVWEFARDCADRPYCTTIGSGPVEVPEGHDFNLTERAYLDHRTNTGPGADAIVRPWAVWYGDTVDPRPLQGRVIIE